MTHLRTSLKIRNIHKYFFRAMAVAKLVFGGLSGVVTVTFVVKGKSFEHTNETFSRLIVIICYFTVRDDDRLCGHVRQLQGHVSE